jgi:hypothetical protein
MKPRARFAIAASVVLLIGASILQRSSIASAFSHPWIAFGAGFVTALIVVAVIGMAFVGASANDDGRHF